MSAMLSNLYLIYSRDSFGVVSDIDVHGAGLIRFVAAVSRRNASDLDT